MGKFMNQDEEKFLLVAYSKNDSNNRKYLNPNGQKYCTLARLDSMTSRCSKEVFIETLLKNNIIKEDQTEFVIWFKQGDVVKQLPVIFGFDDLKEYAEYLLGNNDEDHTMNYDTLNNNIINKFVHQLDIESEDYDKLSEEEKVKYMDSDSYSARYCRYEFAKTDSKERVRGRILGSIQFKDNERKRVKNKGTLNRNYYGIKNEVLSSYRSFREKYVILHVDNGDFDKYYKDLSIEDLNKKIAKLPSQLEQESIIENSIKNSNDKSELEILKKVLGNYNEERIYTLGDYVELLSNKETKDSFNDFIYYNSDVTKKVKDYTNRMCNSMNDDNENLEAIDVIEKYHHSHPNKINQLIKKYYSSILESN